MGPRACGAAAAHARVAQHVRLGEDGVELVVVEGLLHVRVRVRVRVRVKVRVRARFRVRVRVSSSWLRACCTLAFIESSST